MKFWVRLPGDVIFRLRLHHSHSERRDLRRLSFWVMQNWKHSYRSSMIGMRPYLLQYTRSSTLLRNSRIINESSWRGAYYKSFTRAYLPMKRSSILQIIHSSIEDPNLGAYSDRGHQGFLLLINILHIIIHSSILQMILEVKWRGAHHTPFTHETWILTSILQMKHQEHITNEIRILLAKWRGAHHSTEEKYIWRWAYDKFH